MRGQSDDPGKAASPATRAPTTLDRSSGPRAGASSRGARLLVEGALGAVGLLVFVLLGRAFVRGGQVVAVDDKISRWAAAGLPPSVEWSARVFTWLGSLAGTAVVTAVAAVALLRASRRWDAGFVVLATVGITVLVPVLKAVYERARPSLGSPIALPHSYSFPSGHAATAVILYGALGVLAAEAARSRPRAAAWLGAAAAFSLAIGSSRFLLDVHFFSDVIAGFAVGLAFLCSSLIVRDLVGHRPDPVGRRS